MPLFAITFPTNAKVFYSIIIGISTFDILPSEEMDLKIFSFKESEPFSPEFEELDIFGIYIFLLTIINS